MGGRWFGATILLNTYMAVVAFQGAPSILCGRRVTSQLCVIVRVFLGATLRGCERARTRVAYMCVLCILVCPYADTIKISVPYGISCASRSHLSDLLYRAVSPRKVYIASRGKARACMWTHRRGSACVCAYACVRVGACFLACLHGCNTESSSAHGQTHKGMHFKHTNISHTHHRTQCTRQKHW